MIERNAATAALFQCPYCDAGFRRVHGIHVGSQQKGMIPNVPCERVFAVHGGKSTDGNERPFLAYADGETLKNSAGVPRRFSSAATAYRAACRTAPYREHATHGDDHDR